MPEAINRTHYPNLYQASDAESVKAQHRYVWIVGCDLVFMIIAAGLAIYNYQSANAKEVVYVISGIFLLTGLIFTIILRTKKFEDIWYQGRALAESCKTLTWRYMTCSEGFEEHYDESDATEKFVDKMKELGKEFTDLHKSLNATTLGLPVVSDLMKKVRQMSFSDRKGYYIKHRLQDQKEWYSTKAELNREKYNLWFLLIILSQGLAIVSITLLIIKPDSQWNYVGIFTTIASSAISWLQLKQHQELKQAYTTATLELNSILALSGSINTSQALSRFVLDSENAISREHTLWLVQRRK